MSITLTFTDLTNDEARSLLAAFNPAPFVAKVVPFVADPAQLEIPTPPAAESSPAPRRPGRPRRVPPVPAAEPTPEPAPEPTPEPVVAVLTKEAPTFDTIKKAAVAFMQSPDGGGSLFENRLHEFTTASGAMVCKLSDLQRDDYVAFLLRLVPDAAPTAAGPSLLD